MSSATPVRHTNTPRPNPGRVFWLQETLFGLARDHNLSAFGPQPKFQGKCANTKAFETLHPLPNATQGSPHHQRWIHDPKKAPMYPILQLRPAFHADHSCGPPARNTIMAIMATCKVGRASRQLPNYPVAITVVLGTQESLSIEAQVTCLRLRSAFHAGPHMQADIAKELRFAF